MLDKILNTFLRITKNNYLITLPELSVEEVRTNVKKLAALTRMSPIDSVKIEKKCIETDNRHKIAVNIFFPEGINYPCPVILYFHGGGFVLYNIDDFESFCQYMASKTGSIVVIPEYRCAPEYKFPAAYNDAINTIKWVYLQAGKLNIDCSRIVIAGDSAGGNLAAALANSKQEHQVPLFLQLLIYPVLTFKREFPSYKLYGSGYFLNTDTLDWFWNLFQNPEIDMLNDRRLNPFLEEDLSDSPPLIMVTAEYDILRDEGLSYYVKMLNAGRDATLLHFDTLTHNFILMGGKVKAAVQAIDKTLEQLNLKLYNKG